MLKRNNTKSIAVIAVAVFAVAMVLGPVMSSVGDASARHYYTNWKDCREDYSEKWCKDYFKKHDRDDKDDDDGNRTSQSKHDRDDKDDDDNDDNGNRASQSISQGQS
ncbi:MAG: hypothetical protein M3162_05495, partial [Thermoproteota archaeon]|nr:hypothetical protein [Thermoproteota archaeon]